MKRRKFFKGTAVFLALALLVMSIPAMATEAVDVQPEDEAADMVIPETDSYTSVFLDDDGSNDVGLIENEYVPVTGISLNKKELSLGIGDTYDELTVTIDPEDATDQEVIWESSDESIATVDEKGVIEAVDEGTAAIKVTSEDDPDVYAECAVTVEKVAVTGISISETSLSLEVGEFKTLSATIEPDNATNQEVSWTSDNESVATVDEEGLVEAVAEGNATITVTSEDNPDAYAECEVTVDKVTVTGVTISDESLTMNLNDTYTLTATVEPSTVENDKVNWTSSDETVVTVDENGNIKAVKEGTATITATSDEDSEYYAECKVTVQVFSGFQKALDGNWYYYENGSVKNTTDVIKDTVGTIGAKGEWWNVVNGKVTSGVTVAKNSNGWWYIDSTGKVDFTYDGFASNSKGKWYCEKGKVNFDVNNVLKDTAGAIGAKGNWYYVVGSEVQTSYTGVANYKNSNGWWYIKNGQVDFTANTVAKNKNGWWYVEGGKVIFSYSGFGSNSNGKWYCESGKVTFNKNSVIKDTTGALGTKGTWYYVVGSKVQTNFTGLANYKNSNGWWYIKNGQVDFTHNGVDKNNNGWWYVTGGKVQFGFTGLANYKNSNGWWYIKSGKVDFSASGVYKNKNGWWYVNKGKVDFSFNGIASNSNGYWVIKDGKVDFSYNGTYTYQGVTYNVTGGKASHPATDIGMDVAMYNKAQSQSSSTKWLIMVDVTNCRFGIFQGSKNNWTPYKYWQCTTGASGSPTCIGSYTIYGKGKSFGDSDHTCYWYSQFNGNYLIHSILYYPGTMTVKSGTLGAHLSNGCIRLSYDNAKWVYDNVPYSTRVVTYK